MIKRLILLTLATALLYSCSSYKPINSTDSGYVDSIKIKEKQAKEFFITGTIFDVKDDYESAIKMYNEALKLDNAPGIHYVIAEDYIKINKLPQALHHAKAAVKLDTNSIEYNTLLGRIYLVSKQPDSAITIYNKIISLDSTDINSFYRLAKIYEKNRPSESLIIYRKLLDITGPEWGVLVNIAEINERLGDINATIKTVEELLQLTPNNIDLKKILIESYIKNKQFDEALALIDDLLMLFPDDTHLLEYKAKYYIAMKSWNEAADQYMLLFQDQSIQHHMKLAVASAFLNQANRDSSSYDNTKRILHAVRKDSSDWQINAFLGQLELDSQNDSLALEYFSEACEKGPWNMQLWVRLGGLLFDSGKYERAAVEMEKAIVHFPDEFFINIILGLSYSQKNNHKAAEQYLNKAVTLNPNDLNATMAYGFTLNRLHKEKEAILYLKRALNIDSRNIQALGILGLIYDGQENWVESDKIYDKAMLIDSTDITILNNYAYSLAVRGLKLEQALSMVKQAVDKEPENSSYLDTMGWVYYMIGNYDKAKEYVEKALEIDDNSVDVNDHYGDINFKLGNVEQAMNSWKKALELDEDNEEIKKKIDQGGI